MSSPEGLRIRDARPGEDAAIRDLTMAAYAEFATVMEPSAWEELREALVRALATGGHAERIVAERDGGLVGSVMLYPPDITAYSDDVARVSWPVVRLLAVAPEARGQGIGRALMDECVRRARRAGATEIGLHTSDSLRAAIRMYERMGFARVPEHDFRSPGSELVKAYRLSLDAYPGGGRTEGL